MAEKGACCVAFKITDLNNNGGKEEVSTTSVSSKYDYNRYNSLVNERFVQSTKKRIDLTHCYCYFKFLDDPLIIFKESNKLYLLYLSHFALKILLRAFV